MSQWNAAVIGAGFIGRVHLQAIRRLGHIRKAALGDPELDKAKQLGAEFSIGWVAADFQDILRDPAIDAVRVCTPNHLHFPVANAALEAAKHVIFEKPLATSVEDAKVLVAAAARAGKQNCLCHNLRYYPVVQQMRRLCETAPRARRGRCPSSCQFCRGIDLTGAAMGAANLMTSQLVGRDQRGNLIGAMVRAGLPNLQTAMPQYADYTDEQIADPAAYVHYLRQQGRYKELIAEKDHGPGDPASGRQYVNRPGNCGSCHSPAKDLAGFGSRYDVAELRAKLLRPGAAFAQKDTAGGDLAHLKTARELQKRRRAGPGGISIYDSLGPYKGEI